MRFVFVLTLSMMLTRSGLTQQRSSSLPRVGDQLPAVTAWAADGREFSLTELRGDYSVLVFGCLT